MADPVSWLQIEQGWSVVADDGVDVGTVAQVEGDKQSDIFDGLALESPEGASLLYLPAESIAAIYPGRVTLRIGAAEAGSLEPFEAPPPQTTWRPGKRSLSRRITDRLRGRR